MERARSSPSGSRCSNLGCSGRDYRHHQPRKATTSPPHILHAHTKKNRKEKTFPHACLEPPASSSLTRSQSWSQPCSSSSSAALLRLAASNAAAGGGMLPRRAPPPVLADNFVLRAGGGGGTCLCPPPCALPRACGGDGAPAARAGDPTASSRLAISLMSRTSLFDHRVVWSRKGASRSVVESATGGGRARRARGGWMDRDGECTDGEWGKA